MAGAGPRRRPVGAGPAAGSIALGPVGRVSSAALETARSTLAARLHPVWPRATVRLRGDRIVIGGVPAARRAEVIALTGPGRLTFFDWEASVITPQGRSLVAGLRTQDPQAQTISQGRASASPGDAAAGGLPLAAALSLARRVAHSAPATGAAAADRPAAVYLIGTARTQACGLAAVAAGFVAPGRGTCLLAGPASSRRALGAALPHGVALSDGHTVTVPAGEALMQASAPTGSVIAPGDARARFFLVRGPVALTGSALRDPHASTDQAGAPDVQFQFTARGAARFQAVTAAVAHRGQMVSAFHQSLNQHFAIALDGRLLTVPQIDFRTYPDGISGTDSADITGGLTRASARALAAVLARGPLGVSLAPR